MKRTRSKSWFTLLKERIHLFRKGHMTIMEVHYMIGSKIEWCWKFGHISDKEKDQLVDDYILALRG